MRLVIDIPDDEYERIQAMDWKNGDRWYSYECIAIHNGKPLPKGHGRLIDAEELKKDYPHDTDWDYPVNTNKYVVESIDNAPTIIEADTTRDCKTCGHSNDGKCAGTEECHECMWVNKYIEADKEGCL